MNLRRCCPKCHKPMPADDLHEAHQQCWKDATKADMIQVKYFDNKGKVIPHAAVLNLFYSERLGVKNARREVEYLKKSPSVRHRKKK